jgi:nicotinamide riboside transporter PnuC
MLVLIALTAIGITVTGIVFEQDFIRMLPLYVSLMVMLFSSEARRIALLIGGFNSLLYAYVDYTYGLYSSAVSTVIFSGGIQLLTFIVWTKRKDGKTTHFRSMTKLMRILLAVGCVAAYIPLLIINVKAGSFLAPIDTFNAINGAVTPVLMLLAFIETNFISAVAGIITIFTNIVITTQSPDRMCYIVYSVYSAICTVRGLFNTLEIYKRQQERKKSKQKIEVSINENN